MVPNENYRPIPCDDYSEYEVAILHRNRLRLRWVDESDESHLTTVLPKDLVTESGKGEFLIAEESDGNPLRLRLDLIKSAEVIE